MHCCHISGKAKIPRIFLLFPKKHAMKGTTSGCCCLAMQESGVGGGREEKRKESKRA